MNTSSIVVQKNGIVKLYSFSLANQSTVDNELFKARFLEPKWLGFYDWLRASDGSTIGIYFRPDEDEIDGKILNSLISLDYRNSINRIYIFFGSDRIFDPSRSDDSDFGNNIIFDGNMGSLAISFNSPAK